MPDQGIPDPEFERVFSTLAGRPDFVGEVGSAIRQGIDDVLDGARTGRFDLFGTDVNKNERTHVGTRIEILVISSLGVKRGKTLDMVVAGIEVDIKTTIGGGWMIPREAVNGLCLLIESNDRTSTFGVGLLRTSADNLTPGSNQDAKRSVSAAGKERIRWFGGRETQALPPNFLLQLESALRAKIMCLDSGQQRVREAFRLCLDVAIPRAGVATIAQQLDPMKRVRDARKVLKDEGIRVLSTTYDADEIKRLRIIPVAGDFFVSTRRT